MKFINIKNTTTYNMSAQAAFAFVAYGKADVVDIMKRTGPIPGIKSHILLTERWGEVGSTRLNYMDDGNTAKDVITIIDTQNLHFQYEVIDITFSLKNLVKKARGDWYFKPIDSNHCTVEWYYGFMPKNIFAILPLFILLNTFIKRYLKNALQRAKNLAEQHLK